MSYSYLLTYHSYNRFLTSWLECGKVMTVRPRHIWSRPSALCLALRLRQLYFVCTSRRAPSTKKNCCGRRAGSGAHGRASKLAEERNNPLNLLPSSDRKWPPINQRKLKNSFDSHAEIAHRIEKWYKQRSEGFLWGISLYYQIFWGWWSSFYRAVLGWVYFDYQVPPFCSADSAKFPCAQAEPRWQWNDQ